MASLASISGRTRAKLLGAGVARAEMSWRELVLLMQHQLSELERQRQQLESLQQQIVSDFNRDGVSLKSGNPEQSGKEFTKKELWATQQDCLVA